MYNEHYRAKIEICAGVQGFILGMSCCRFFILVNLSIHFVLQRANILPNQALYNMLPMLCSL